MYNSIMAIVESLDFGMMLLFGGKLLKNCKCDEAKEWLIHKAEIIEPFLVDGFKATEGQ